MKIKSLIRWKTNCDSASERSIVGLFSLFRFATKWELFLLIVAVFFTFLKSFANPLDVIAYSELISMFVERSHGHGSSSPTHLLKLFGGGKVLTNASHDENFNEIFNDAMAYSFSKFTLTIFSFVTGIISIDVFNYTALKQITRIRTRLFQSLIRQDVGWHDVSKGMNFAAHISDDIEKVHDAIGEKMYQLLFGVFTSVVSLTIAFFYGWKLTLAIITYMPLILGTNFVYAKIQAVLTASEISTQSTASNLAEEVLGGIRTVLSFCGQNVESKRYDRLLRPAEEAGKRAGIASGVTDGLNELFLYVSQGLGFWYGAQLVLNDRDLNDKTYTPAVISIVSLGVFDAIQDFCGLVPFIRSIASARGVASSLFPLIDRIPKIDALSGRGKLLSDGINGIIEFKDVVFSYPSRPDVPIFRQLNLTISAGQTVALVGSSGNGKSTILQLLQRFYDPNAGQVLVDGCDIAQMNVSFLRSNLALVGQEPVLFSTSISENIRYGKPEASENEIIAAAKYAGAHDFVSRLPQGYNTLVGERGCQMSGGQKQRIAIARALVQNPRILILDEATSALDYQSEKNVQRTLDKLSEGRTTIVVSHRISAIRNADRILFIENGEVIENGSHKELLELRGRYHEMVTTGSLEDSSGDSTSIPEQLINENEVEDIHENQPAMISSNRYVGGDISRKTSYWIAVKRVLLIVKSEWIYIFIGVGASVLVGASVPVFGILAGEFYGSLAMPDAIESANRSSTICVFFGIVGFMMFFAALAQTYYLNLAGIRLGSLLRSATFKAMLRQEMGWFDDKNNSVGALLSRLSGDTAGVQAALGFPLSRVIHCISIVTCGAVIGFYYSWKVALISLSAIPCVVFVVLVEAKHMAKINGEEKRLMESGLQIASEAIANIRTVASLRQESHMIQRFAENMRKTESLTRHKVMWRGTVQCFLSAITCVVSASTFYYAGLLISREEMHFTSLLKILEAVIWGTRIMTRCLAFTPSFTTAFVAAQRIFEIVDRNPLIESASTASQSRQLNTQNGIEYKSIDFRYPTRPDIKILRSLDLEIVAGQTIALVGASGSGKSTLIQLLQRFYDPERGRIRIGLDEISTDVSIENLRSTMSLVSQEPVLFDRTIAENIAYGDNSREVDIIEIIEAAKAANAHNFIASLPLGYNTNVGSRGTQLSGGQKQRIAIARALIRNPHILLLDEATSALDLQSEQIVQQALDAARAGRTCLVIAHRLSTVQNADVICVVENGQIVERGTHRHLLALDGTYTSLYNAQK